MTADGQCWELPTLERRISGTGSGCVPNGETFWHTPNTNGLDGGSNSRKALQKRHWPTPQTRGFTNDGDLMALGRMCDSYEEMSRMAYRAADKKKQQHWPTPTVCGNYNRKGLSERSGDGLATAVMKWPTPTAHNAKEGGFPAEYERNTPTLAAQAGGSLNPTWVEWLMGWPLGWTDLKPLATDKSHSALQQRGDC
jgi:DNA (cytosine-5)-methyltransferase 1